jgi:hypothetical protein
MSSPKGQIPEREDCRKNIYPSHPYCSVQFSGDIGMARYFFCCGRYENRYEKIAACIPDIGGVVTDTARLHAKAWKRMFDWLPGTGSSGKQQVAISGTCPAWSWFR